MFEAGRESGNPTVEENRGEDFAATDPSGKVKAEF